MRAKTDLDKIKIESIVLLHAVDIEIGEFALVSHPFTNMPFGCIIENNEPKMLDLSVDTEKYKWFKYVEDQINKSDLSRIYMMINKPYKLIWIKLCKPYMSEKDFSEYLADAWVISENPNQDVNVSLNTAIGWFKKCPKEHLMVERDLEVYKNIPDKIILYRGVSKTRNPYGLSYTKSKDKAIWFKERFFKDGGFIITLEVKKKDILVYFNTRGEDEYVVDVNQYKKHITKQIPKQEVN